MGRGGIAGGATAQPALRARRVSKRFGAVQALDGVELTLLPGEVHGLLGENGSGKSTLIKVLSGYHAPEPGSELEVEGSPVRLPLQRGVATRLGLRFAHQEPALIPSLSVLENLLLEELAAAGPRRIRWRLERRRARERLARHGLSLDPEARVADLQPLERARLAIVRALDERCRVLVLDEPTAFLPEAERRGLFQQLRSLADDGTSVLLTSHELAEARGATDRVTVLRAGRTVGTVRTDGVDDEKLREMVMGRRPGARSLARVRRIQGEDGDGVRELCGRFVRDAWFDLVRGEVVGLAGLPGSGHDEVPYLLFGARPARGRLRLEGRDHDLAAMTPHHALHAGVGLAPADRVGEGAVASMSVADNVMLPSFSRHGRRLRRRRMHAEAAQLLEQHGVAPAEPTLAFGALSGGNQQKAILAKWLHARPTLLLLDEPLRGVDVGARDQVATTIRVAAHAGTRVLCASADPGHLAHLCDRVLVFERGVVVAALAGDLLTADRIAELCHGAA